jgi:hypothetical protein
MKTTTTAQEQVITLATFTIVSNNNKELNDKLSQMMAIIDKKFIEPNVQYDTDMKCILDDDQYLSELSELDLVNQVVTLYNDVFGVNRVNKVNTIDESYKHFIEVKSDVVIANTRYLIFEVKGFNEYYHYSID